MFQDIILEIHVEILLQNNWGESARNCCLDILPNLAEKVSLLVSVDTGRTRDPWVKGLSYCKASGQLRVPISHPSSPIPHGDAKGPSCNAL